jgi:ribose/xylose/arabinose/galactoside ABC-type transport system permease subunit
MNVRQFLLRYGVLSAVLILLIIFSLIAPGFLSARNMVNIAREMCILSLFAMALTTVVIAGGFDLAFASGGTMAGIIGLILIKLYAWPVLPAFALVMLINLLLAGLKGYVVINLGMPAFIATLAIGTGAMGVSRLLTGGTTFFAATWPAGFEFLGRGEVGPIPIQVFTLIIFGSIMVILLERTRAGRYAYAIGGNEETARHVGIKTAQVRFITWIISGILCGIATMTLISQLGVASPEMGEGYLLPAISSMFLGCLAYREGVPNILGTITAAAVLTILSNGFVMLGLRFYWKDVATGIILLIAVGVVSVLKKGKLYEVIAGF